MAEQLYKEQCHFLFELIQNADDNLYEDGVLPQVTLAYRSDGLFLFGCNEVGFSKANVDAICNINKSTKTLLKEGKKSCIGEKGIGFKAVFKVASRVWISSNNYTFMFDKSKPLGMVDPIWADFPAFSEDLRMDTMICLKIDKQEDRDSVREELTKVLEPSSFMFLRRLSKIRIVKLDATADVDEEITLLHEEQPLNANDLTLIKTTKTKGKRTQETMYVVSDYTVQETPTTERRQEVTESLIRLAFPIDADWKPLLAKQDIYAFLPICSSGLPFLIQADFLLVASRQEIEAAQPWNRRLQEQLVHALINAFQSLNDTRLRYHWPAYLPKDEVSFKFCNRMIDKFFARVDDTKILESRSGELAKPKVMMLVPGLFKDEDGTPLLTPTNDRFLSMQYELNHVSALVRQSLDGRKFVEMLKNYVSKSEDEFRNKSGSWHARVCAVLLAEKNRINIEDILVLPIIPLDNNTWINPKSRYKGSYARPPKPIIFYLPPPDESIVIPKGVSLSIVEPSAAHDEIRRRFYREVGARALDSEEVLKGILKQHQTMIRDADVDLLLSHAQYVFSLPSASRRNLGMALWLTDTRGDPFRGTDIHMDAPGSTSVKLPVSQYFSKNPSVVHFIHPKYLTAYQSKNDLQERWLTWLSECLGVHSIPRLADRHNKALSKEFEWMVINLSSREWLTCLKDNWGEYQLNKVPKTSDARIPSQEVRDKIGNLVVECTDGKTAKLNDTILPSLRSIVTSVSFPGFHFLDLSHEDDQEWHKLSCFGVITTRDLNFCVRLLVKFSQNLAKPDKSAVARIYKDILMHCEHSATAKERTKAAFKNLPLVYLNETWVYLQTCVWDAPLCLRKVRPLAPHYSIVKPLFKSVLGLQDANADDFVAELSALDNDAGSIESIKDMLLELSDRVRSQPNCNFTPLKGRKVFPVVGVEGRVNLSAESDNRWFISDAPHLKDSFKGVLPLLDFDITNQERLEPLLHAMQIWNRRLSQNAEEQEVVEGESQAVREDAWTDYLQDKVHYLLCLTNRDDHHKMKPLLESFEIYSVRSISIHRFVIINHQEVRGKVAVAGFAVSKDQKIFVPIEDLESRDLDYYKLAEKLAPLCGFQQKHLQIVSRILSISSNKKIETMLSENHINFEKRRFQKSSIRLIDDSAGIVLPSKSTRPGRLVEDTASHSSETSSEVSTPAEDEELNFSQARKIQSNHKQSKAAKSVAVPLNIPSRVASERYIKPQQTRERGTGGYFARESSNRSSKEDTEAMPALAVPLESLFKASNNGSQKTRASKASNKVVVSDDDINDIDDEDSDSDSSEDVRASSIAYRARYMAPKIDGIDDTQAIRIGEQGEMKVWIIFDI